LTRFRRGRPETARSLLRCSCHVAQAQYILLLKRQRPDDTIPHRSTGLSVMWCIKRVSRLRVGRRLAADSLLVYMWVNVPYARPWQDSAVIVERRSRMEPAFVVCAGREWPRRRLESTPHQRPSRVLVLAHPRCLPARHLHLFPARSYRLPRLPPGLSDAAASMERCACTTHIAARSSLICPPSGSRSRLFDGFLACRQPLRRRLNG
jgi:hypothetical protein